MPSLGSARAKSIVPATTGPTATGPSAAGPQATPVRGGAARGNAARVEDLRATGGLDAGATGTDTAGQDGASRAATAPTPVDELYLQQAVARAVSRAPQDIQAYAQENIPRILERAAYEGVTDANQVAYLLATAEHESKFGKPEFNRSQSLVEDHNPYSRRERRIPGQGRGRNKKPPATVTEWSASNHVSGRRNVAPTEAELDTRYWDSAYGGRLENERGTDDASRYRGRGFVQLTGRTNYRERTNALQEDGFFYMHGGQMQGGRGGPRPIDLLANPTHVNESPDLAAHLLVTGARDGSFTNQSLEDYIPAGGQDPDFVNARRVINGDTAKNGEAIAAIARRYAGALSGVWPRVFRPNGREGGPR